jgi:hypothetical protein
MNIHFSLSMPWADRAAIANEPGVYIIAKNGEVIYIGKTWGTDGLRGRLADFHRSATTGLKGHAGGVTFNGRFGQIDASEISVRVHVPLIIRRDADILNPYINYIERRLIWEHVEQFGRLPACNSE